MKYITGFDFKTILIRIGNATVGRLHFWLRQLAGIFQLTTLELIVWRGCLACCPLVSARFQHVLQMRNTQQHVHQETLDLSAGLVEQMQEVLFFWGLTQHESVFCLVKESSTLVRLWAIKAASSLYLICYRWDNRGSKINFKFRIVTRG